jgi:hypothetical protein
VGSGAGSTTLVPLNEHRVTSRADDEASEEPTERVEESQEHDPDAPGLGIARADEPEHIPEPNEPS